MSPPRRKKTSVKISKTSTKCDTRASIIEESSKRDVLASKGSLEQRFNDQKIKYKEKQLRRDILINKCEISKLEVKLAELKRDYEAMQLDNNEKEQKIILLENEIASLLGDGIEDLQNELESMNKKVNDLMIDKNSAISQYVSLKKEHKTFQDFHDQQMKEQFSIEDTIRIQLNKLKQKNRRLESLLNSDESCRVNNPSQIINLDAAEIKSSSLEEFSQNTIKG
ncbi:2190_t:CDS:2 [Racocetra persica]|uniref:2190_t:CDS:1 n=1 Tax=Racocetra persica TaxID=160502 RepID=A0ACA9LUK1_9GLOM|nr:2190_t:CDS:2 [Racocetra persica]